MAKRIFKITEFEGGENRVKDARDLDLNECAKAKGVSFDKIGRLRLAGSSKETLGINTSSGSHGTSNLHYNSGNATLQIASGYGIFSFGHDHNMPFDDTIPQNISSEFIAIAVRDASDTLFIGFVDSESAYGTEGIGSTILSGFPIYKYDVIDFGTVSFTPKISYYFVDGGLRIFDAEFRNNITNTFYGHVRRDFFNTRSLLNTAFYNANSWIEENQSLEISSSASTFSEEDNRPCEGTAITNSTLFFQELGNTYPDSRYKVFLEIEEDEYNNNNGIRHTISDSETDANGVSTLTTNNNHGFYGGDIITIFGLSGDNQVYEGQYEVISGSEDGATTFTISADAEENSFNNGTVVLAEDTLNPELRAKWIYGISYILDGGQETQIATGSKGSSLMSSSNADDWTGFTTEPKMRFAFNHQYAGDLATHNWSERITGFRIYMKNIEGTTADQVSQEWHLLLDVDFVKGIYVIPGTDATERDLLHSNSRFYNVASATEDGSGGDDIRFLSPITYESINGYSNDENIGGDIKYKTAVIANDKCYIGNVKQNGTFYPDRIIVSPKGAYDVFPESNFIEGATSDGDPIVKLEYYGDRLFCFKEDSLQILNLSDEQEYVEETLSNYGVSSPCQVTKTDNGIAFVNRFGIHLHNGTELVNLTKDKINPFNFNPTDLDRNGFFIDGSQSSIGYDKENNKLILVRSTKRADYPCTLAGTPSSIAVEFISGGQVYEDAGNKIPSIGDIIRFTNTLDFSDDDLSLAKHGETGRTISANDCFIVRENNPVYARVEFLDMDADALIYDLNNNCLSFRNYAYGNSVDGSKITNFINTNMLNNNNKLLALQDKSSNGDGTNIDIMEWDDNPVIITDDDTFEYKTRDIDFGDPSVRKKIYKVYVTFKTNDGKNSHSNSNINVYHLTNQDTSQGNWTDLGDWTLFDNTKSTNYNTANGLYSESDSPDSQVAELIPTSSINNIYSFQLLFRNTNGNVPRGFEINDISIVYRTKSIK